MNKPLTHITYWTYPEGDEFEGLDQFKSELSKVSDIKLESTKTDACGGGLYELAIQVVQDMNILEFVKSYTEDAIKFGIGFYFKQVFSAIKALFKKNQNYEPDVESVKIVFRDVEIFLHSIYKDSIDAAIQEVLGSLSLHYEAIMRRVDSKILSIHIPIFNHVDAYEVCAYRVRLNCDENIENFKKEDYFKLWGIRCDAGDFIYDLGKRDVLKTRFYTQEEYDELLDKKFAQEPISSGEQK